LIYSSNGANCYESTRLSKAMVPLLLILVRPGFSRYDSDVSLNAAPASARRPDTD
jgi:hypothetical protein